MGVINTLIFGRLETLKADQMLTVYLLYDPYAHK